METSHRPSGCLCLQCWSLFEYMARLTGKDYGLQPAPGHAPPARARLVEGPSSDMMEMAPGELAELQARARKRVRQPWENAA